MTSKDKKDVRLFFSWLLVVFVLFSIVGTAVQVHKMRKIVDEQQIDILANRKQIGEHGQFMGIVRGLTKVARNMSPAEIVEVSSKIAVWCTIYKDIGFAPNVVFAMMEAESGFDPTAISNADAYGLMQCIRATFEIHLPEMGYKAFTVELALNPIINIEVGIRELVRLRKYWMAEGYDDWMVTMTSYFWGIKWTKKRFLNKGKEESEYGKEVLEKAQEWKRVVG